MLQEIRRNPAIQLAHLRWPGHHVCLTRERQKLELAAGVKEGIGQLNAVQEVDVVVRRAVDQQAAGGAGRERRRVLS